MVAVFERTDGDIAAVLRTMFLVPAFSPGWLAPRPAREIQDPMQFVVSALRLAHDGAAITNYRPLVTWLHQPGQPLYGRVTPEGYAWWNGPGRVRGQMVARFEIARAIGSGRAELFNAEAGEGNPRPGLPTLNNDLFRQAIEPTLGGRTATRWPGPPRSRSGTWCCWPLRSGCSVERPRSPCAGVTPSGWPRSAPVARWPFRPWCPAHARPPASPASSSLVVFLRGGYDAANVVIPVGSSFYYEARPTLAIRPPDPAKPAHGACPSRIRKKRRPGACTRPCETTSIHCGSSASSPS